MEQMNNLSAMMDLMIQPAFAVKNGIIEYANPAARHCMISQGVPAAELIETGNEEYADAWEGCLYLTLCVEGCRFGASVTRMDGFDLFLLDAEQDQPQLQALALAARELRGPLSSLMVVADYLSLPPEKEEVLGGIMHRSLFQLLRLVSNMSDAVRYTTETTPRMDLQDISAIFREIFEKSATVAENTGVALRFSCCQEQIISLADPVKLERAVYNILSNAIKFTPRGGSVEATLCRKNNKVIFTVTDTGSGISDQILGNVFTRHLRQPSLEDSRQGIGLGMVIVRAAAAAHGGTVLVQRLKGSGTRLCMTLAIRKEIRGNLGSPRHPVDYAGEFDHALTELSDVLPRTSYK